MEPNNGEQSYKKEQAISELKSSLERFGRQPENESVGKILLGQLEVPSVDLGGGHQSLGVATDFYPNDENLVKDLFSMLGANVFDGETKFDATPKGLIDIYRANSELFAKDEDGKPKFIDLDTKINGIKIRVEGPLIRSLTENSDTVSNFSLTFLVRSS